MNVCNAIFAHKNIVVCAFKNGLLRNVFVFVLAVARMVMHARADYFQTPYHIVPRTIISTRDAPYRETSSSLAHRHRALVSMHVRILASSRNSRSVRDCRKDISSFTISLTTPSSKVKFCLRRSALEINFANVEISQIASILISALNFFFYI